MLKVVEKLWGREEWLVNQACETGLPGYIPIGYCLKRLTIMAGYRSSLHYHRIKDETFLVTHGLLRVEDGDVFYLLRPGDTLRIPPERHHRFWSASNQPAIFLEVSTFHDDADVVRLEPSGPIPSP